jgi:peptidase E
MTKRILATSGGFVPRKATDGYQPGGLMLKALELTGKERPKVTFIMTASGDDSTYLATMYSAMSQVSADVDHLALFSAPNHKPAEIIGKSDLVWVGGGSVANLLAVWRAHELDQILHDAWDQGTILAGVSAGSICWHIGGPTDSFGKELKPVLTGLALLPYGNGVHYDSEIGRRPAVHELVQHELLPRTYATDDHIGILYQGTEPIEVIADSEVDPVTGPAAYMIEKIGHEVTEIRLPVGPIKH